MKKQDVILVVLGIVSLLCMLYILGINVGTFLFIVLFSFIIIYFVYAVVLKIGHFAPKSFYLYFYSKKNEAIHTLHVLPLEIYSNIINNRNGCFVQFQSEISIPSSESNCLEVFNKQTLQAVSKVYIEKHT